jgi:hypothetical protein
MILVVLDEAELPSNTNRLWRLSARRVVANRRLRALGVRG